MRILFFHTRRQLGPQESSWFTLHNIAKELEKRGHILRKYSGDYNLTDERGQLIRDNEWHEADALISSFRNIFGPLEIARVRGIPSFVEMNIPCPEVSYPFMKKEAERLGLSEEVLGGEGRSFDPDVYNLPTALFGIGNAYTQGTYHEYGVKKMHMFRSGIDVDVAPYMHYLSQRGKNGKVRFTFTAAILNFRKGMYHMLEAWSKLPPEYHTKAELHLFGTIPQGEIAAGVARMQKQYGNIIHHGYLSNSTPEFLSQHALSDSMICPTFAEGQSATALEGMALGLYPIVSPYTGSDFGEVPSTILSHDPSRWIDELPPAIMKVVDTIDAVRAQAPAIAAAAEAGYRWDNFGAMVADYIEQTVAAHKKKL